MNKLQFVFLGCLNKIFMFYFMFILRNYMVQLLRVWVLWLDLGYCLKFGFVIYWQWNFERGFLVFLVIQEYGDSIYFKVLRGG